MENLSQVNKANSNCWSSEKNLGRWCLIDLEQFFIVCCAEYFTSPSWYSSEILKHVENDKYNLGGHKESFDLTNTKSKKDDNNGQDEGRYKN